MLHDGAQHGGSAIGSVNEFAIGKGKEESNNRSEVDRKQEAHRLCFAQGQQDQAAGRDRDQAAEKGEIPD